MYSDELMDPGNYEHPPSRYNVEYARNYANAVLEESDTAQREAIDECVPPEEACRWVEYNDAKNDEAEACNE